MEKTFHCLSEATCDSAAKWINLVYKSKVESNQFIHVDSSLWKIMEPKALQQLGLQRNVEKPSVLVSLVGL